MRNLREILKEGEVLVWMDFAGNFNCLSLEEVQSAYWNSEMVTLHTQVIYFPRSQCFQFKYSRSVECSLSQRNFIIISMLRKLISLFKENNLQLEKVNNLTELTDVPILKQCHILLRNHQNVYEGNQTKRDYLKAGHGKGPCDDFWASLKTSAVMAIKQSKVTLQSAEEFFVWAKNSSNNSTVSYIYILQNDYDTCDRDVRAMCDNTLVVTVPGTMKAHAAVPVGTSHVSLRDMSCNCSECLIDVEFMEKAGKLNDTFK